MNNFPKNPENGEIFESSSGVFYAYDSAVNSWFRLEASAPGAATPVLDGNMVPEDFDKLDRLVIPPPQSTLTSSDTITTFSSGFISLKPGDQFINVDTTAPIMNKAAGIEEDDPEYAGRSMHQHTYSFDISVDTEALFNYMVETGKFVVRSQQGPPGPPGDPGVDGDDELPYGQDGQQGSQGSNASYDISLQSEPVQFQKKDLSHRAIIDMDTEEVNSEENYLVVTRANIGNPDACPSSIRLNSLDETSWVVAVPASVDDTQTTWLAQDCLICSGQIYYLDLSNIMNAIRDEFIREATAIRHDMEQICTFWMTIMSGQFDEQKASLCCALEYCRSQHRNTQTRQYIEQARIQAAQTQTLTGATTDDDGNVTFTSRGHSVLIDGEPHTSGHSVVYDRPMDPACEPGGFGAGNANALPNNADPIGGSQCVPGVAIVDGKTVNYPECPPGFIPRDVWRENYVGVPFDNAQPEYPSDYSPGLNLEVIQSTPQNPYQTPSQVYQPSQGATPGRGVSGGRSTDPATQATLIVRIQCPAAGCSGEGVTVNVGDRLGDVTHVSGVTAANGEVRFENLSSTDNYRVSLSAPGWLFDPNGFSNIRLSSAAPTTLETRVITVGTPPPPGGGQIQDDSEQVVPVSTTCTSGGTNIIKVALESDSTAARQSTVRVFTNRSSSGNMICGAQAGPNGNIEFENVGFGAFSVVVEPPSGFEASFTSAGGNGRTLSSESSSVVIEFKQFDGDYQARRIEFAVRRQASPASAGNVEIITPDDLQYGEFVAKQMKEPPPSLTINRKTAAVELQHAAHGPGYHLAYVNRIGVGPEEAIRALGTTRQSHGYDKLVNHYNDELNDGLYTLCITNNTKSQGGFELFVASQNAKFVQGHGDGWSDNFIQKTYINNFGVKFAPNTAIICDKGPAPGIIWWVQFRVVVPKDPPPPYSVECGASGPHISPIDKRLCTEPRGPGGTYEEWVTSKCGSMVLPDALNLSGPAGSNIVLCRGVGGNYSTSIVHDSRTYKFLVEQIEPVTVQYGPSHLSPLKPDQGNKDGGTAFKCTMFVWDSVACSENVSQFASVSAEAKCDPFMIDGEWDLGGRTHKFSIKAIDNAYGDARAASNNILTLSVSAASGSPRKDVTGRLQKGEYIVDISECCLKAGDQFTGHIEVEYQVLGGTYVKRFPNLGSHSNEDVTRSAYKGLNMQIEHDGGDVTARLVTPVLGSSSGSIVVRFMNADAPVESTHVSVPKIVTDGCQIHVGYLRWYEEGWKTESCSGLSVNVAGQDYIIVRRSSNAGSGPCGGQFEDPAIAWPTLDGKEFVPLPSTGSVTYKRDKNLESMVSDAIANGRYSNQIGDLDSIKVVLFPTTLQ